MTLTFPANGATLTSATETTINEITSDDDQYWGAMVFIPTAFTTGDSVEIRFYAYDINAAALRVLYYDLISGAQTNMAGFYYPVTPCRRYRLTFKRTAGTDRTLSWYIAKQTG